MHGGGRERREVIAQAASVRPNCMAIGNLEEQGPVNK